MKDQLDATFFYFTYYALNMFWTLVYLSSVTSSWSFIRQFCILFNLYANSQNNTKLNYVATSITLPQVSHEARS